MATVHSIHRLHVTPVLIIIVKTLPLVLHLFPPTVVFSTTASVIPSTMVCQDYKSAPLARTFPAFQCHLRLMIHLPSFGASHAHVSIVMRQVSTFTLLPVVMDGESPTCQSHLKYPQLAFITATSDITETTLRLHPVQFLISMHDMERTAGFLPGHVTGKIPL